MTNHAEQSPSSQKRRRGLLLLILLTVLIAATAAAIVLLPRLRTPVDSDTTQEAGEDIPLPEIGLSIGLRAPDFTLDDLEGNPVTLSDHYGSPIILDFWASWCGPCQVTFPALYEIWEALADEGAVLIGVSLDRRLSDAVRYVSGGNYDGMISLWESLSAASDVADAYDVGGIPHTLILDVNGVILFKGHPAYLDLATVRELLDPASRPAD